VFFDRDRSGAINWVDVCSLYRQVENRCAG
jgi:hypothetical protein